MSSEPAPAAPGSTIPGVTDRKGLVRSFGGPILPVGRGLLPGVAWRRSDDLHGHRYPRPLLVFGALAWVATAGAGIAAVDAPIKGIR